MKKYVPESNQLIRRLRNLLVNLPFIYLRFTNNEMIATRIIPLKIRYIIFLVIFSFVTWKLYEYTYKSMKNSLKNKSALKDIRDSVNRSRVTVTVYYEALCPDSRSFFIRHLLPTYTRLPNVLEVELVPYGKANTRQIDDDHFEFDCQHGINECFANKIHSCAIHYIQDPVLLLNFVTCMIENNDDPEGIGIECSQKFGVSWKPIFQCSRSSQGNWLLKKHGEETNSLNPTISFVPTVLLNKNRHNQASILKNLYEAICSNYRLIIGKECVE
ncbi:gamma-interferon-inducible lysosomal thiol reductase-like [Planococcus citri]|uniref:gamma-interferon-inducible lysosomal thiol reductase-like n=1 Tax=Planococcus citri TaxID=170843 RepID=UPI0031F84FDC